MKVELSATSERHASALAAAIKGSGAFSDAVDGKSDDAKDDKERNDEVIDDDCPKLSTGDNNAFLCTVIAVISVASSGDARHASIDAVESFGSTEVENTPDESDEAGVRSESAEAVKSLRLPLLPMLLLEFFLLLAKHSSLHCLGSADVRSAASVAAGWQNLFKYSLVELSVRLAGRRVST